MSSFWLRPWPLGRCRIIAVIWRPTTGDLVTSERRVTHRPCQFCLRMRHAHKVTKCLKR